MIDGAYASETEPYVPVDDVTTCRVKGFRPLGIGHVFHSHARVAAVQLHKINPPICEGTCILGGRHQMGVSDPSSTGTNALPQTRDPSCPRIRCKYCDDMK